MIDNKLVEENIPLVKHIARKFPRTPVLDREDYVNAGILGLMKCLKTYDSTKGKISTYAYNPILWEMIRLYEKHTKHKQERLTPEIKKELVIEDEINIDEYLPSTLTKQEEKVIKLWLNNIKISDIAKTIKKSESSVFRILKKSKEKISDSTEKKSIARK